MTKDTADRLTVWVTLPSKHCDIAQSLHHVWEIRREFRRKLWSFLLFLCAPKAVQGIVRF